MNSSSRIQVRASNTAARFAAQAGEVVRQPGLGQGRVQAAEEVAFRHQVQRHPDLVGAAIVEGLAAPGRAPP